jgi:hypothetical protein
MIDTVVDGLLPQSTDFMCNVPARILDNAFLEMMAARIKAESFKMARQDSEIPALELKAMLLRIGQKPT